MLYQNYKDFVIDKDDHLTNKDWYKLYQFRDLLKPIYEVSMLI